MSGSRDPAYRAAAYNRDLRARHRAEAAAAADGPARFDVREQLARWDAWFNLNAATGPSAIDRSEP